MSPGRRPRKGSRPPSALPARKSPPTTTRTMPNPMRSLPRSATRRSLQRELLGTFAPRLGGIAQVLQGRGGDPAPARAPDHEADLEEIGLDQLGQGLCLVVDGGGDRLDPDRADPELLDDRLEEPPVEPIEPARVDAFHGQGSLGGLPADPAVTLDLGVVAHTPEEPVGDAWGAASATGQLAGSLGLDHDPEDPRRP